MDVSLAARNLLQLPLLPSVPKICQSLQCHQSLPFQLPLPSLSTLPAACQHFGDANYWPASVVDSAFKTLCNIFLTMASFNCFILAFFISLAFLSMDVSIAARNLLQLPPLPSVPNLPKLAMPPIPAIPTLPQPSIPTLPTTQPSLPNPTLPPLPSLPTMPAAPKVTLPPMPSIPSIPSIPTTIPSIPFLSPPPAGN
ncbi:hypothetical protein MANES_07G036200v8 [Manihot esculenta]|uniref:Uncharacterized protein n=1 Tax=Manihot esculenta TaxID=3983 RepID=A0ACB7HCB6_MANES|nr:hypothetical protein MANES_07G036200v8 [Manihot esculenta]